MAFALCRGRDFDMLSYYFQPRNYRRAVPSRGPEGAPAKASVYRHY